MTRIHWFVFADDADRRNAPCYQVPLGESKPQLSRKKRLQQEADEHGHYFTINTESSREFIWNLCQTSGMDVRRVSADYLLEMIQKKGQQI